MGSLGLNGEIPWLKNKESFLCFICKQENEILSHLLCLYVPVLPDVSPRFGRIWSVRLTKAAKQNTFATRMPSLIYLLILPP